eukprot:m.68342 g.68342  ORF g.68342 m.68342 type:complete len:119 (-) comp23946_c0_seq1:1047-1403(-)
MSDKQSRYLYATYRCHEESDPTVCLRATSVHSATIPNVFIWGRPRSGTTLVLNSLASSGHWGGNVYMEPFNFNNGAIGAWIEMGGQKLPYFDGKFRDYIDFVEKATKQGPFIVKEIAS